MITAHSMAFLKIYLKKCFLHEAIIGGLLGFYFFYFLIGPTVLNPSYIAWLLNSGSQDTIQHFIGWEFFRNESWHFPLGLINNYGAPIGTSIVYTDSIPLLAILFKCLQPFLSSQFQYFGLWLLFCFILQGIFAWLICSFFTKNFLIKGLMTCFFLLSPIMLNRIADHQALVAHWLLLAGLYLYIKPFNSRSPIYWLILNSSAVLIHAYLAFILLFLWIAFLIKNLFLTHAISLKSTILQIIFYIFTLLLLAWQAGYFIVPPVNGIETDGFNFFAMNLLAPLKPTAGTPVISGNWSVFIAPLTNFSPEQSIEGFNYFGLGMLFLIIVGIFFNLKKVTVIFKKEWLPLTLVNVIFFLYALSNTIHIGTYTLLNYSIPLKINFITEIFRNPARFFWPVYYSIMIIAFSAINKFRKDKVIIFLAISLLLQTADLLPKLKQIHFYFNKRYAINYEMNNPFWNKATKKYTQIAFFPIVDQPQFSIYHFQNYIYFAATHHIAINEGYFARNDQTKFYDLQKKLLMQIIQNHKIETHTVYIITKPIFLGTIKGISTPQDKIIFIPPYFVFAPNWNQP